MEKIPWFAACWLGCLLACTPAPPPEAAVRSHLKGRYCDETFTLVLADSTYQNRRRVSSPLGTGLSYEACQGRYHLQLKEDTWYLVFEADPHPRTLFSDCQARYAVWNPDEGYLAGPDTFALPEPFSSTLLPAGACP